MVLPYEDSIVSTELECDIQPGALRERYSVQWKQQHNDTSYTINDDSFNLTLSVNSNVNGLQYRCEVTIDHDGEGVNRTYQGRTVTIVTKNAGIYTCTVVILCTVYILLHYIFNHSRIILV